MRQGQAIGRHLHDEVQALRVHICVLVRLVLGVGEEVRSIVSQPQRLVSDPEPLQPGEFVLHANMVYQYVGRDMNDKHVFVEQKDILRIDPDHIVVKK